MKYYFFRLEIQDGEHGYYSKGVLSAKHEQSAHNKANRCARYWYEGEPVEKNTTNGELYPLFDFTYQCVTCCVDEIREISKEHYDMLTQYL